MHAPSLAPDIHVSTGHATDKTASRPTPSPRQRTHPQPQQCHATTPHSSQSAARWICSGPRGVTVSILDCESGSNPREALLRFGNHAAHANASHLHLSNPVANRTHCCFAALRHRYAASVAPSACA